MDSYSNIYPVNEATLSEAAETLRAGKLVAFPTETVYGLGADATSEEAVASIFATKERPSFNPLIVHIPEIEIANDLVEITPAAEKLMHAFWPGALTLVLPRKKNCALSLLVSAGLDSVAIRLPAHPVARQLLRVTKRPIAAPSANKSGEISPTLAAHVGHSLGAKVPMILDGGACPLGLESTVVDACGEQVGFLRPGGITPDALEQVAGPLIYPDDAPDAPKSPGMLTSHYAPDLPVRLNATDIREGEILLGFGPDCDKATLNLSESANLDEAAANLFAMMRTLDQKNYKTMAVSPIPQTGLGLAINDRLKRAAAPR